MLGLRQELQVTRQELQAARSVPPVVVEVPSGGWSAVTPPAWSPQPYVHPDAVPQPAPAASSMREDLLLQEVAGRDIDAPLVARTVEGIADIRASSEGREGVQSFLQKRKPNWLA